MYDPSHLRTFLTVSQTLSFTQAARRLGLRQSTVSQHVRRLEDAVGRTLFTRDTHSVELTEDGEAMLGFARRILAVHEQATAFFTGARLRGRLRFGASEDFVLTRLPEILEGFRYEHPEVDLELTVELSGTLHERLAESGTPVGFSTSGPAQSDAIRAALAITVAGEPLFSTVQSTYNVLETSASEALAEAHAAGLTVIVKEGMANGRLAGDEAPEAVRKIAEETGVGPDAIALAWILAQPWTGFALSGAATTTQLTANLKAEKVTLDDEQKAALATLAEPPATYWATRSALPWH
ncbi:aldo/keto reductase [Streptomyces niveiscabiei]|uniref:aldo/keto reductase n=1 Tax=Streptomyces niveiscabiei TaxID=164115 RepID=UPI0006EB8239|nr:aldo/keto reductase [Streptomyces niveiscabiei]